MTLARRKMAIQLSVFLAVFFIVWTLRATVFYAVDESIASPTLRAVYSNFLKLILWVLPAVAFVYWLRRASPAKYLGLSVFPNARVWSVCLVITVVFLLSVALVELWDGRKSFSGSALASSLLGIAPLWLLASALFEELLFRGLVMKELMFLLPTYIAATLTSLLFMAVHLPYWLSHGGLTQTTMTNAFGVFLFSLIACWLFAKSASIWPPTLAHIANNLLSSSLVAGST
jgi:uncharacterized protein